MTALTDAIAFSKHRLARMDGLDLQKRLYASLYEHCRREVALCKGAVNQLDPKEKQRVIGAYGEENAWRWCATDEFQRTLDCLDELIRRAEVASGNEARIVGGGIAGEPAQSELDLKGGRDDLGL